ncbi:MAG: prepilin peptidase [Rhizobiaceae bacterium]
MQLIFVSILLISAIIFIYVAVNDFLTWKIKNIYVYVLISLFFIYYTLASFAGSDAPWQPSLWSALAACVLLFTIGFTLWAFKLLGAGDAKLLAPIGLFIGWSNLVAYSVFLLLLAVFASVALKFPVPFPIKMTRIGMRLVEIRETSKVPYGVLMVGALFATILHNHAGLF